MANQYDTNLKLQAIADAIGDTSSSGLISALEDIADAVAGGGGGSSAGLVSDNFSETDTYDLGDYCIHNNTLYVCINAIITPGPWDLSDWQATNAGIQLSLLNSALTWKQIATNVTSLSHDLSQYKEILIDVGFQGNVNHNTIHIITAELSATTHYYSSGYYRTTNDSIGVKVGLNTSGVTGSLVYVDGNTTAISSTFTVYAR